MGGFWIRFGDTDPYGVVYYSTYHRFAHQAVEDFLREKDIEPSWFFRNEEFGMPVVASSGRFTRPVRYPAYLIAHVSVERVGRSSITFKIEFREDHTPVAELSLTFACIDRDWNKRELPEEIRKLGEGI